MEKNLNVPSKVFLNFYTHCAYEVFHSFYIRAMIALMILFCSLSFLNKRYTVTLYFISFTIFLITILCIPSVIFAKYYYMEQLAKLKLLREIINYRPSLNFETWDIIAVNVNTFMFENSLWNTPYYFYDGKKCHKIFKEFAIAPYIMKDSNSVGNTNVLNFQESNSNDDTTCRYLNVLIQTNIANFEIQNYLDDAIKVYSESVNKYWLQKIKELQI